MRRRMLLVSDDPAFIARTQARARGSEVRVIACLGPTHGRCNLYENGDCPLAGRADSVLVVAPSGGSFRYHGDEVPAGVYAEDLQRAHPQTHVYLCASPEGASGPTGEVTVLADRETATDLLLR